MKKTEEIIEDLTSQINWEEAQKVYSIFYPPVYWDEACERVTYPTIEELKNFFIELLKSFIEDKKSISVSSSCWEITRLIEDGEEYYDSRFIVPKLNASTTIEDGNEN